METVQQRNNMEQSIFKFKPYKLKFVSGMAKHRCEVPDGRFLQSGNSRCFCHDVNIIKNRGNMSPKPRSGHRIVCDDVNMYSFGGYNPFLRSDDENDLAGDLVWADSKPLFKELWKYNVSFDYWKKLVVEDIPNVLASNAVLLSGRMLMVYGGTGTPFGANCSNDLYICDLGSNRTPLKFKLIPAFGSCPQPQYGQAIVLVNNFLYTVGGTTGYEYTCDIHRLNLKNGMWEAVYNCKGSDNEPMGRYRHEIAFDNNKIYVLGGGTADQTYDFQTVFAFNLTTLLWEKIITRPDTNAVEEYPTSRRCHSCVQQNRYAYIIGGFSGNRTILRDFWRLDLTTLEWKKVLQLSLDNGVYFHSSCLTPSGKLITFGGLVSEGIYSKRTSQVHSAWLCIPKLKEICWEAVLFYCPFLDLISKSELLALGLPDEFITRLDLPDE